MDLLFKSFPPHDPKRLTNCLASSPRCHPRAVPCSSGCWGCCAAVRVLLSPAAVFNAGGVEEGGIIPEGLLNFRTC